MLAKEYLQKVKSIVGDESQGEGVKLSLSGDTPGEILIAVRDIEGQLKMLKKEIREQIKNMKSEISSKQARMGTGFLGGMMMGLLGRKKTGKINAVRRDAMRIQKIENTQPYENIIKMIDTILHQLSINKAQIKGAA